MLTFQLIQTHITSYENLQDKNSPRSRTKNEHVHMVQTLYPQLVNSGSDSIILNEPVL